MSLVQQAREVQDAALVLLQQSGVDCSSPVDVKVAHGQFVLWDKN